MKNLNLLKLSRIHGISESALKYAYEIYETAEETLAYLQKFAKKNKRELYIPSNESLKIEYDQTLKSGAFFIEIDSKFYPKLLKEIPSAPLILTAKGNKDILSKNIVGIVGTREPDAIGRKMTKIVTDSVCFSGLKVCSGLARGIDGIAHLHSLEYGCIGFLPHGISLCYPPEHKYLIDEISGRNGIILTEFSFDQKPVTKNFAKRNRLVAGCSHSLIIIQCLMRSGTMITAKKAQEFHKNIYAISAKKSDENFTGNYYLISKKIAKSIEEPSRIGPEILKTIINEKSLFIAKENIIPNQSLYQNKIFNYNEIASLKEELNQYFKISNIKIDSNNIRNFHYLSEFFKVPKKNLQVALLEILLNQEEI